MPRNDDRNTQGRPSKPAAQRGSERQPPNPVNGPGNSDLKVVRANEIGAGTGLDEAELARVDPLDGEPWDGKEEE